MQELLQYNLNDVIGWLTTRWVPMNQSACNTILSLVENDTDFESAIPYFAGMNLENSSLYSQMFGFLYRNDKFINIAKSIIVPPSLYTYLEMAYLLNNSPLDDRMVTMLMTAVSITPEFSTFLTQLDGINSGNSLNYQPVIRDLIVCPIFKINAQKFYLMDEDNK